MKACGDVIFRGLSRAGPLEVQEMLTSEFRAFANEFYHPRLNSKVEGANGFYEMGKPQTQRSFLTPSRLPR